DDVDVGQAIFILDAEEAVVIAKINTTDVGNPTTLHREMISAHGVLGERGSFAQYRQRLRAAHFVGVVGASPVGVEDGGLELDSAVELRGVEVELTKGGCFDMIEPLG